jgi:hypothetical protein
MTIESSLLNTLKILYPDGTPPEFLGWSSTPLLGMIKKRSDFGGRRWDWALNYGQPANRTTDATTAFSNTDQLKLQEFTGYSRIQNYSSYSIQGETILASKAVGSDSYVDDLKEGIAGINNQFMQDIYFDLWLDGSGKRGNIGSVVTGAAGTVTLSDITRAIYFEDGQKVVAAAALLTGNIRGGSSTYLGATIGTDLATVTAINYITGVITFDNVPATWANGDYLFMNGDRGRKAFGLQSWCPVNDPTGTDNFLGVNRSINPVRLAGIRANRVGGSKAEKILHMIKIANIQGVSFPTVYMHPDNVEEMTLELGAKQHFPKVDLKSTVAGVFYQGLVVEGFGQSVAVVADRACPIDEMVGMDASKEFELDSLGQCPRILDLDGNTLRMGSGDSYSIRLGGYYNVRCPRPKNIVRGSLTT